MAGGYLDRVSKKNLLSDIQRFFLPFSKDPADKLRSHSQISCESWLNNVGSELRFFSFLNKGYGGFKKLVFILLELHLNLVQKPEHFDHF